jgi:hypothetical protein
MSLSEFWVLRRKGNKWWIDVGGSCGVSVATAEAETDGDEEEQAEGYHAHEIPSMLVDRSRDVLGYSGVQNVFNLILSVFFSGGMFWVS